MNRARGVAIEGFFRLCHYCHHQFLLFPGNTAVGSEEHSVPYAVSYREDIATLLYLAYK